MYFVFKFMKNNIDKTKLNKKFVTEMAGLPAENIKDEFQSVEFRIINWSVFNYLKENGNFFTSKPEQASDRLQDHILETIRPFSFKRFQLILFKHFLNNKTFLNLDLNIFLLFQTYCFKVNILYVKKIKQYF